MSCDRVVLLCGEVSERLECCRCVVPECGKSMEGLVHSAGEQMELGTGSGESRLIVSVATMEAVLKKADLQSHPADWWRSMIDTGATVTLLPRSCAERMGLPIMPHTDGRRVGTADQMGSLEIHGWIDLGGYIGYAAVCSAVGFIIVASCQLQSHQIGLDFYSCGPVCELYTPDGSLAILNQCPQTRLYYCDLWILLVQPRCLFIPIEKDVKPETHYYGLSVVTTEAVTSGRKRKPTTSMSFRVWRVHRRFKHVPLRTLSNMLRRGLIINCDVTPAEIDLVSSHQDCMACALARWKKLDEEPSSGIRPLLPGQAWSVDYQGPYAVAAVGGFTGMFMFVCLSTGYGIVFLVTSKTELYSCVKKVNVLCNRYGHVFESLRVDAGRVEASADFLDLCACINGKGSPGIVVRPANVGMQQQNPVERYVQTSKNMMAAMMVGQDLLPASFWGWAAISAWKTLNCITNSLCPESTPIFEFEHGKVVDASLMFRHAFGQAVVSTRMGKKETGLSEPRNEFGVVVCPGDSFNGSDLVYLPERGKHHIVVQRYHLRDLELGSKQQLTLERVSSTCLL